MKPRVNFRGKTDTAEQVVGRTAGKLKAAYGMDLLSNIPPLTGDNKREWDKALADAAAEMKKKAYEIEGLCERARAAAVFEVTLNILSEEAALADLDKVYAKGGNGKWKS